MLLRIRFALDCTDGEEDDEEPDMGRLVPEEWPELRDPREDIYTEEDGQPIPPPADRPKP